jgi:hypothetical protein
MLPSDLDHGAPRFKAFDPDQAVEAQQDMVDLLDEAPETALVHPTSYQQTLCKYHEGRSGKNPQSRRLSAEESTRPRTSTSSLCPGKDHTRSWRWSNQEPTD